MRVNSWAEVEEAVADALYEAFDEICTPHYLDRADARDLARVAIDKIRELRLTAVSHAD